MSGHKTRAKTNNHLKLYQFINDIGWDNIKYEVIEEVETDEKIEARKRERFWIDTIEPSLNKCLPCRTNQQYREDNKEELKFRRNIANLSKRNTHNKNSLNYYYKNIEKITQQRIKYRMDNVETVKKNRAITFTCGCGSTITCGAKVKHLKSKKHSTELLKNILLMKSKIIHRNKNIDIRI